MSRFGKIESNNENHSIENTEPNGVETKSNSKNVLFVCNTGLFVSPVAAAIFNEKSGEEAISAGIAVPIFSEPQFATIRICQNHGLNLSNYSIIDINDVEMGEVRLILTATGELRDYLRPWYPNLEIFTIKEYSGSSSLDVEDPIGGTYDDYERVFNEIEEAIFKIIDEKRELIGRPIKIRNFQYLDDLIHSDSKEIILDSDIILEDSEEDKYHYGISLDEDDLVIDGGGHVVDAQGKIRIFNCTGGNITIKNIVLKNGFSIGDGGAILNTRKGLKIIESTFMQNSTEGSGGAIFNLFASLHIEKSSFIQNIANDEIVGGGGAIHSAKSNLTIIDSKFIQNTSKADGGAIYNEDGELTVIKSKFKKNNAVSHGGAINNEKKLDIDESIFVENTAESGGSIKNHFANFCIIKKSLFEKNSATHIGGVIYNYKCDVNITDSKFRSNMSNSNAVLYNEEGNFKIFSCGVIGNESSANIISNSDSLQIYNTDFKYNLSGYIIANGGSRSNLGIFGGRIIENNFNKTLLFNCGKFCSIDNAIFEDNINDITYSDEDNIINKTELTLINPKIKSFGKMILNEGHILIKNPSPDIESKIYGVGTTEISGSFPDEEKFDFGYLDKRIHQCGANNVVLDNDIFLENYEIDFYEGGIELDMDDVVIDGNGKTIDASERTRIFIVTGKNITLKNITFKNGHSHRNYDNLLNSNGGAIKVNHGAVLRIENCYFADNFSEGHGGAIVNMGNLNVNNSAFINNTSEKTWGGNMQ